MVCKFSAKDTSVIVKIGFIAHCSEEKSILWAIEEFIEPGLWLGDSLEGTK